MHARRILIISFLLLLLGGTATTFWQQEMRYLQPTPVPDGYQAAIITQEGLMYFRSDYNRARYCTAKSTGFVGLTLKSLPQEAPPPMFVEAATQSYGCQLPSQYEGSPFIMNF